MFGGRDGFILHDRLVSEVPPFGIPTTSVVGGASHRVQAWDGMGYHGLWQREKEEEGQEQEQEQEKQQQQQRQRQRATQPRNIETPSFEICFFK